MLKFKLLPFFLVLLICIGTININCLDVYEFSYNGKKYEIVKEKMGWNDASAVAVDRGGYLVHIDSKDENDAVFYAITQGTKISQTYTSVMDGGGVAYLWIGATDKFEEGKWLWDGDNDGEGKNFWNGQGVAGQGGGKVVDGFFANWGGKYTNTYAEPDDFWNNQDAAAMALEPWPKGMGGNGIAGEWNDISVMNTIYYVIEYDEQVGIPELINPENNSVDIERKPTFLWKSVNADFYNIIVSKKQDFSSEILIDESTLIDTLYIPSIDLEAGAKLFWKVRAKKDDKDGEWSQIWNFTVKDIPPPAKPSLVSPENGSEDNDTLPKFIWNKIDADSYHLIVSLHKDFSSDTIIDIRNITDTSFRSFTKLTKGQEYYWAIRGFKKKFGEWSDKWSFKVLITKPEQAKLFLPPNKAEDVELKPLFRFSFVTDADLYKLIISKYSDLSVPILTHTINAELNMDTIRIEEDLEQDTRYYWSVNAINTAGETQGPIWEFKTKTMTNVKEDIVNNNLIKIYPNPAVEKVFLNITNESQGKEISIYNSLGVLIDSYDLINNQLLLDIESYPNGIYLVYLKDVNGKFITYSLLIKKQ